MEAKEFVDRARAAFAQRNKYVHGLQVGGERPDELWLTNRRSGTIDMHKAEVDNLSALEREFS